MTENRAFIYEGYAQPYDIQAYRIYIRLYRIYIRLCIALRYSSIYNIYRKVFGGVIDIGFHRQKLGHLTGHLTDPLDFKKQTKMILLRHHQLIGASHLHNSKWEHFLGGYGFKNYRNRSMQEKSKFFIILEKHV